MKKRKATGVAYPSGRRWLPPKMKP